MGNGLRVSLHNNNYVNMMAKSGSLVPHGSRSLQLRPKLMLQKEGMSAWEEAIGILTLKLTGTAAKEVTVQVLPE